MFFDPTCKPETKADPYTIEAMIAWLEKQPANKTYPFMDCFGGCLFAKYLASHGHKWQAGDYAMVTEFLPPHVAAMEPWTYGAALERARAAASA